MPTDPFNPYNPFDPNNTNRTQYTGGISSGSSPITQTSAPPAHVTGTTLGQAVSGQSPQVVWNAATGRYDSAPGAPAGPTTSVAVLNANEGLKKSLGQDPGTTGNPVLGANPNNAVLGAGSDLGESSLTLGGNPNAALGDPARALANGYNLQAYAAGQRNAPQIDTGATNMFAAGTGNALQNANATNLYGVRQGLDLAALSNGTGVQGQFGAANALMGMSQLPAGPSAAEQQLRMGGDAAMRQQMAMAAGARGGNAALALQNAGQNQGDIMGNINQQAALQRAQETLANRQFAANAAQAGGNMFGAGAGTQANALMGAGNIFGGVAGNQLGQANTNAGLTQTYAGLASDQGKLGMGQNALNDQTSLALQGMGYNTLADQRAAEMGQMAQNANVYGMNQNYALGLGSNANAAQGNAVQSQLGNRRLNQENTNNIISGIGGAAATMLPFLLMSDIRAKKDVAPAGEDISDAFRSADQSASALMGTPVSYPQLNAPGYSYEYKDPNAPGMAPGQQYGPMAQDLEKTPAGASVVHEVNGKKAVDPGRLALLNASETAKQRKEIDQLKAALFMSSQSNRQGIMAPQVSYPTLGTIGM